VLEKMDAKRADNLRIWNALGKTDPAHTKSFSRAGGFKGTAIKPIWITQRLTELFGPCGDGWGMNEPRFNVVPAGDEVLVYCTVAGWYVDQSQPRNEYGGPQNVVYGVGGDKIVTKRNDGKLFHDDEAFKKAFTDALGNAFKFVGVGADVHMGLFEDSKYLAEVRKEFTPQPDNPHTGEPKPSGKREKLADLKEGVPAPYPYITHLMTATHEFVRTLNSYSDLEEYSEWGKSEDVQLFLKQLRRDLPGWWGGGNGAPEDWVPIEILISQKKRDLEQIDGLKERK
jgi:hypothetical protein